MHRFSRFLWVAVLVSVAACRQEDRLHRVEVHGKVLVHSAPVARGLITFRPAKGARGPAAGTVIIDGRFMIPTERGPVAGPTDVEVKIGVDSDLMKSEEPALALRGGGQLKSFSQHVEITKGVNEFEFSFSNGQPTAGKHELP
jgi:hypothetical protein